MKFISKVKDEVNENGMTGLLGFWMAVAMIVAYIVVLGGSLSAQFLLHELPCPLCVIQRYSMLLAVIGPIYIIISTLKHEITVSKFAAGYGLSIIAAMLGIISSVRQVLLHIAPGDKGYGGAFLGLHFYTWSLITFLIVIVFAAFNMIFAKQLTPTNDMLFGGVAMGIINFFFFLVVVIFVAIIFELGFNFKLPDDPVRYQLFDLFK